MTVALCEVTEICKLLSQYQTAYPSYLPFFHSLSFFSVREFLVWVLRKKHLKLKIRQKVISVSFPWHTGAMALKVCYLNRQHQQPYLRPSSDTPGFPHHRLSQTEKLRLGPAMVSITPLGDSNACLPVGATLFQSTNCLTFCFHVSMFSRYRRFLP